MRRSIVLCLVVSSDPLAWRRDSNSSAQKKQHGVPHRANRKESYDEPAVEQCSQRLCLSPRL